MAKDHSCKRDLQSYWQHHEILLQEAKNSFIEIDRRRGPDRRADTQNADKYAAKTARRRMPDRRISSIEVDWINEDLAV